MVLVYFVSSGKTLIAERDFFLLYRYYIKKTQVMTNYIKHFIKFKCDLINLIWRYNYNLQILYLLQYVTPSDVQLLLF